MSVLMRVMLILVLVFILAGCGDSPTKEDNEIQDEAQERVRRQRPIPEVNYSQTYETIVKWMDRWNVPDKVSYVYILADNGQMIGYYVAQGRPVSNCTFLTNPVKTYGDGSGTAVLPAPALDGVYYGNCGNASTYFFTADTDAFIEISGNLKFFVTDQPLAIDVEELKVDSN